MMPIDYIGQDVLEVIVCSSWRSGLSACHDAFGCYILEYEQIRSGCAGIERGL